MAASSVVRMAERQLKRLAVGVGRALTRAGREPLIDPRNIRSILVVRQHNQLGDMLCVVPLLRALRSRFNDCRIVLLTSPVNYEVMRHHRLLDAVINYDKRKFLRGGPGRLGALREFRRSLRGWAFDLAIVPATVSMSLTSDFLAYLSGARWRIGPGSLEGVENPGAFFYTHPAHLSWSATPERHQTLRNVDVCGILSLEPPDLELELTLLPEELKWGKEQTDSMRAGARYVVAFQPGAGKPPNRWPAALFAEAMTELHREDNVRALILKGPMDKEPVELLTRMLGVPYYLSENHTIREDASIIKSVDLLVSNDTGIMHVGAAVGTPVLSLFGPTDPALWAPPGTKHRYIRSRTGRMQDIPVAEVVAAVRQMLPPRQAM